MTQQNMDDINGKVLIVDDNNQNGELLQAYLDGLPVEAIIARDGTTVDADLMLEHASNERLRGLPETQKQSVNPRHSHYHDHCTQRNQRHRTRRRVRNG